MLSAGSVFLDVLPNMSKFGPALKAQSAIANTALGGLATAAGIGGAAIAMVGVASLKAAIDFESAFAGVRKTVDASEAEFAKLEKGIRDMAKSIPASTTEIAAVAEAAGQLGIKTDDILGFTRVMIDLGNTTNLAADEAANSLARIANITQMPQNQFDRLGSTVVDLGNKLATTEAELVEMSLRIAGAGAQIGLSEDQILGFAAALSSVGINAEAGGSSISRTFIDIAQAVSEAGPKLATFADLAGVTSAEFSKMWGQDAAGAMTLFVEGLGDIKESGGDVFKVLRDLEFTEIRQRDALLRLAGAGDLLNESLDIGAHAWRENNALSLEAQKRYDTTASKLSVLWNMFVDIGITIGQKLLPVFNDLIDWLTVSLPPGVRWVERFVGHLTEAYEILETISGARTWFVSDEFIEAADTYTAGVEKMRGALDQQRDVMESNMHPMQAYSDRLSLQAAAYDAVADAAERFRGKVNKVGTAVKVFAGMTIEKTIKWSNDTIDNFNLVSGALEELASKHKLTATQILRAFEKQLEAQREFGKNWSIVTERAGDAADGLLKTIQENYGAQAPAFVKALAEANDQQFSRIIGMWNTAGDLAKKIARTVVDSFGSAEKSIGGARKESDLLTESLVGLQGFSNIKISTSFKGAGMPLGAQGGTPTGIANTAMAAISGFQTITSGYRPGDRGWHGVPPPGNAVDVGGSNLLALGQYVAAQFGSGLRELIHTPLGFGIKEGARVPLSFWGDAINAAHYGHVHIADEGGTFVNRGSGVGLVGIGARMSEQVTFHGAQKIGGAGGDTYYNLTIHADSTTDGRRLARVIRGELEAHDRFKQGRGRMDRA